MQEKCFFFRGKPMQKSWLYLLFFSFCTQFDRCCRLWRHQMHLHFLSPLSLPLNEKTSFQVEKDAPITDWHVWFCLFAPHWTRLHCIELQLDAYHYANGWDLAHSLTSKFEWSANLNDKLIFIICLWNPWVQLGAKKNYCALLVGMQNSMSFSGK